AETANNVLDRSLSPPRFRAVGCGLEQAALFRGRAQPTPWSARRDTGHGPHPAVVEFEVERRARAYHGGFGHNFGGGIANHDIAARQEAFVALCVGGEPAGEIVDRVAAAADKASHCTAET